MARKKCRIKKNYDSNGQWLTIALIVIAAVFLIWFLAGDKEAPVQPGVLTIPDTVDIGTDIPASVDLDGNCVSREGVEMGLCCAVWNPTTELEEWVLCEDLAQEETGLQAFFTFGEGSTLEGVSSVMFAVRLTNSGNAAAGVRISSIDVVATTGGDTASSSEIQGAFESLIESYRTVPAGDFTEFSMNWVDRIRLDIPSGAEEFTMADGIYEATLHISVQDEQGTISDGGSKTVTMHVEQENIQFSIDVQTV